MHFDWLRFSVVLSIYYKKRFSGWGVKTTLICWNKILSVTLYGEEANAEESKEGCKIITSPKNQTGFVRATIFWRSCNTHINIHKGLYLIWYNGVPSNRQTIFFKKSQNTGQKTPTFGQGCQRDKSLWKANNFCAFFTFSYIWLGSILSNFFCL